MVKKIIVIVLIMVLTGCYTSRIYVKDFNGGIYQFIITCRVWQKGYQDYGSIYTGRRR
jgi:hypothetical protein